MHLSILRLLAVGLAGLNAAVAGPCKPRSSASESSVATTVAISSFTLSSDTSATFASTTTEAVISAGTTTGVTTEVTSVVAETDTARTEATTSGDTTTEATTFATSTATTEATSTTVADTTTETMTTSGTVTSSAEITEAPTTTEESTTAAATTTAVPMFRLVPATGTYSGEPLLAKRNHFTPLLFNHAQGYSTAYFTIDTITGRLLLDDTLPICGYFPGDGTSAFTVCDASNLPDQEQYLTCETPTPGSRLECTVPEVECNMVTGCTTTGNNWYTTYIGSSGGTSDDTAYLGPSGGSDVDFFINFDAN
ncbi:activator of stress 1 [Fusarium phyllophilum]|uniref:Activator of stress 1 n=1 Tax=Fusarium phyllophilum TaxID=47803 RepID=A0A8H5I6J4_9HYPO|nr:activator of stress 1 [Fusarium phyllophilum]